MYFISWKTIPQALSTVGKTFLKSLDHCTVNIHHNRSSHLLAMRHWSFFPCLVLLSLTFHFSSTPLSLPLLPPDPPRKLKPGWVGPSLRLFFKGSPRGCVNSEFSGSQHPLLQGPPSLVSAGEAAPGPRDPIPTLQRGSKTPASEQHVPTAGKGPLCPLRVLQSRARPAETIVWPWAHHVTALTLQDIISKNDTAGRTVPHLCSLISLAEELDVISALTTD